MLPTGIIKIDKLIIISGVLSENDSFEKIKDKISLLCRLLIKMIRNIIVKDNDN